LGQTESVGRRHALSDRWSRIPKGAKEADMVAKKAKKAGKKVKDLPAKNKNVKGGAFNSFVNFGDIKGESQDNKYRDFVEIYIPKR
jgi:hypothetical protein